VAGGAKLGRRRPSAQDYRDTGGIRGVDLLPGPRTRFPSPLWERSQIALNDRESGTDGTGPPRPALAARRAHRDLSWRGDRRARADAAKNRPHLHRMNFSADARYGAHAKRYRNTPSVDPRLLMRTCVASAIVPSALRERVPSGSHRGSAAGVDAVRRHHVGACEVPRGRGANAVACALRETERLRRLPRPHSRQRTRPRCGSSRKSPDRRFGALCRSAESPLPLAHCASAPSGCPVTRRASNRPIRGCRRRRTRRALALRRCPWQSSRSSPARRRVVIPAGTPQ
jgi:hypothetical protein